jgi:dipeptidyl aminopeptidase/acylaminoacyl peptidase
MPRRTQKYTIEQFMETKLVSTISFSHDEKSILVSSNQTGIFNAFTIPIDGGPMRQVTHSTDEDIRAVSCFPFDGRILYAKDIGGIESRCFCVANEDGTHTEITHGAGSKAGFRRWTRDGKHFYCLTNERDQRYFDVYKIDSFSYARTLLFEGTRDDIFAGISNDENYAVFVRNNSNSDVDLYVYDRRKQSTWNLTPHEGDLRCLPVHFDLASQYLYYSTFTANNLSTLYRCELTTGRTEQLEQFEGPPSSMYFSYNEKYRVVLKLEGVRLNIDIYDARARRKIELPPFPHGDIKSVAISRSERLMAFYVNGDCSPNDLYVYEFATKQIRKLTNNLSPEIDPADLVESDEVSFKSFDGLEIPCLLWRPRETSVDHKAPALVWVHGGPAGQTRKGYAGAVQFLVNHGYVVLGVNHRGSLGYGPKFAAAADRKQGREPLWDCVEAKRYLATLDYVDSQNIGIIGGSFGGYMTLAALTFHPDEFAAGVDIAGVSNWVRALKSFAPESISRKLYYEKVGDPCTDREMLQAISPLFHAKNIIKPLMVVQGAKDPRVLRRESDEMIAAVRNNGGTVEYLVLHDEAHGFRKRANAVRAYGAILKFLDRHLKYSNNQNTTARNQLAPAVAESFVRT